MIVNISYFSKIEITKNIQDTVYADHVKTQKSERFG